MGLQKPRRRWPTPFARQSKHESRGAVVAAMHLGVVVGTLSDVISRPCHAPSGDLSIRHMKRGSATVRPSDLFQHLLLHADAITNGGDNPEKKTIRASS
jgi:hypothetical protein